MIRSTLLTAAAALLVAGAAGAAPVTIDDFSITGQTFGAPSTTGAAQNTIRDVVAPEAIGGNRRVEATRTNPGFGAAAGGQRVEVSILSAFGIAGVASGINTDGFVSFQWNGGGAGLGGADLVDGTNSWIDINVVDADVAGVEYTLFLDSALVTKTAAVGGGNLRFNFTEFAGEDGTDVDVISLLITGPTSFDTSFDLIAADGSGVVPLPAGGLLALGGLGALGAVRARRARKA